MKDGNAYSVAMIAACPFPANYGSPAAIRELSQTLSERGHDVHVVTYPFGDDLPTSQVVIHRVLQNMKSKGAKVGPSIEKPFLDLFLLFAACSVVRRQRIEIIHAHNYEGVLVGVAAKFVTRKPLVYNAVNLMSNELHTYGFIKPAFLARWLAGILDWFAPLFADHIIAVTQELYDWMRARGFPAERVTLIPCGVKLELFDHASPERLIAKYNPAARPVIMYTGVNSAFQRVDYLLRAFSLVHSAEPSALLMVVSPLAEEPDLATNQALARELGIADNVIWVNGHHLDELPDYLAMATVTVVPRCECPGHPIKLLNYMTAAKPIVTFAGSAKGVTHMHDALVIPNHEWQQMGEAILTLLRDPALAARLGANAKQNVLDNFDWRILCKKVEQIYGGLTKPKNPA